MLLGVEPTLSPAFVVLIRAPVLKLVPLATFFVVVLVFHLMF
jgi:hypothetical protein